MKSIRKFAYAVVMTLSALNFAPSLASAQEPASGRFTLPHDVHWGKANVPAGEYRFSYAYNGVSGILSLSKLDGARKGYLFLVNDVNETTQLGPSRLVLSTTPEGSYVSYMQLPEFGMTLHFPLPSRTSEKQIAKTVTTAMAAAQ